MERVYDYRVRHQVTPIDEALPVAGIEVVMAMLQQLGDFKGTKRPRAEKRIDPEPLAGARARLSR